MSAFALASFFCGIPRTFRRPGRHRRGAHGLRACGHAETAYRAGFSVFAPRAGCHRVRPDHVGGHGIPAGFGPALESTGNRGRDASGPRHLGGRYRVVRDTGRLDTLQTAHFDTVKTYCSVLRGLSIGPLPEGRDFRLRLRVGVTPISVEQERRSRRWLNVLQRGSLLELFISLDRPTKRSPWIDVSQFSPEDLQ